MMQHLVVKQGQVVKIRGRGVCDNFQCNWFNLILSKDLMDYEGNGVGKRMRGYKHG